METKKQEYLDKWMAFQRTFVRQNEYLLMCYEYEPCVDKGRHDEPEFSHTSSESSNQL